MKVKDLIEKPGKYDPGAPVRTIDNGRTATYLRPLGTATMTIKRLWPFVTAAVLLAACGRPAAPPADAAPPAPTADQSAVRGPTVGGQTAEGGDRAEPHEPPAAARTDASAGPALTDRLATEVDAPTDAASELPVQEVRPPTGVLGEPPSPEGAGPPTADTRMTVAPTGTQVDLRVEPGADQPVIAQLHGGTRAELIGRNADGSWLQVRDPQTGQRAWVYGPLTDIDDAAVDTLAMTEPITIAAFVPARDLPVLTPEEVFLERIARTTGTVNLRAGPGTEYAQFGQAEVGDLLLVVGRNADGSWVQIFNFGPEGELPDFTPVWVHAPLLDFHAGAVPAVYDTTAALADVVPELWPRVEWWPDIPLHTEDAYAFEVEWRDGSAQFDWAVSDVGLCYGSLSLFLGDLPQRFGIGKFVLTLTDPPVARNLSDRELDDAIVWRHIVQPISGRRLNLVAWPDWEPTVGDRHAIASAECAHTDARFGTDTGTIACDVYPLWGRPGHWLDGAVNSVLAQTMGMAGFVGNNDHDGAVVWVDSSWSDTAALVPHIDYTAVGPSICAHVSAAD